MTTRRTVSMPARKCLPIALGLSLLAQTMPMSSFALGVAARKGTTSAPPYTRLDAGAGPETHATGDQVGADNKGTPTAQVADADTTPDDIVSQTDADKSATSSTTEPPVPPTRVTVTAPAARAHRINQKTRATARLRLSHQSSSIRPPTATTKPRTSPVTVKC